MTVPAWLEEVLPSRARAIVLGAGVFLAGALFLPLWQITMYAGQFPEGIRLAIYSYKLEGGNGGADLQAINILNHYIGMRPLSIADFAEMKFIPFALGVFLLLGARTALFARVHNLVDQLVLFLYFGLFSGAIFWYRMYTYGHQLDPEAPIRISGFTPPVLGHQHIANFDVYSYPSAGTYLFVVYALLLAGTLAVSARRARRTG